jgi:RNA polymerase sigma-70 factor (ECF subfamily)
LSGFDPSVHSAVFTSSIVPWDVLAWFLDPPAVAVPSTNSREADDTVWLAQAARGDEPALQRLFDKWKLPLLSFFYRSLGSRTEAEDLTLEVFVRLHRSAGKYRPTAKFSTFLFHIARNLLLNELRRRQRKPAQAAPPEAFDYVAAEGTDTARRLTELEEVFQHALTRLPEKYRTPLLLLKQQQMDYAEVAATLRITENALRVLVHRGRQLLKTEMEALQ